MQKKSHQKRKSHHTAQWTIMIGRGVGKVRSFKISSRVLFWAILFFGFYILVSIFVFNDYFGEICESRAHMKELENLRMKIEETKTALYKSQQRLSILQEYVDRLKSDRSEEKESPKSDQAEEEIKKSSKPSVKVGSAVGQSQTKVKMSEPKTWKEGTMLRVDFKLHNQNRPKGAAEGYVHTIARSQSGMPQEMGTYPAGVKLESGIPVDYKRGVNFSISGYRTIRARFSLNSDADMPSSIRVLVYDLSGVLILDEEFGVEEIS